MPKVRTSRESDKPRQEPPGRLPLRWAVILATATAASVPAGAVRGLPAAIGIFFMIAAALHLMVG